jgi:hypothetical protein
MKHVFYFIGLLPLIYEMSVIMNPKKIYASKERIKASGKFDNFTSGQKSYAILSLGYLVWAFIGLFSFNWVAFLFLIAISFIPKKHFILMFADSVVSFIILLFVLLNSYHFKIDLFAMVRSFF